MTDECLMGVEWIDECRRQVVKENPSDIHTQTDEEYLVTWYVNYFKINIIINTENNGNNNEHYIYKPVSNKIALEIPRLALQPCKV